MSVAAEGDLELVAGFDPVWQNIRFRAPGFALNVCALELDTMIANTSLLRGEIIQQMDGTYELSLCHPSKRP